MTWSKRVRNILVGIIYIIAALCFIPFPEDSTVIIIALISFSLVIYGLKNIIYYFTMAMHMVGGNAILYRGIISMNIGLFATLMANIPAQYGMLYLICFKFFYGAVDILRSFESKRLGSHSWRIKLGMGLFNIALSIICLIFFKSEQVFVIIYSFTLILSALSRIMQAFRKTAIVYIQ